MRSAIDSRERLIEVAVSVLAREGLAASSLRMIAVEAGVSPALLVHHFGSRQNLVEEAVSSMLGEWLETKDELMSLDLSDALAQWPAIAEDGDLKLQFFKQVMLAGGQTASHLYERLVIEAKDRLKRFIVQGAMRELPDLDAAAVLFATYALAPLLMSNQIKKVLGGGFSDPEVSERLALAGAALFGINLPIDQVGLAKQEQKAGER